MTTKLLLPKTFPGMATAPRAATQGPRHRQLPRAWKVLVGQTAGSRKRSGVCDDVVQCAELVRNQRVLLVVCADGAGSAMHGGAGARTAVTVAMRWLRTQLSARAKRHSAGEALALDWSPPELFAQIAAAITKRAMRLSKTPREFATTLTCVVASAHWTWVLQVGDGAVVLHDDASGWQVALWPQSGEFVNSTHFVTDVEVTWRQTLLPPADGLAVMTDGVAPIALDLAGHAAFAPFFEGIARELAAKEPGELEAPFLAMLRSPRMADRTDDDLTLVVALRRPGTPGGASDAPA